jgi:hypothetical protein
MRSFNIYRTTRPGALNELSQEAIPVVEMLDDVGGNYDVEASDIPVHDRVCIEINEVELVG